MTYSATTLQARCKLAASYVEQYRANPHGYWLAIGKTGSWPVDSEPPLPSLSAARIPDLYGMWYVHTCVSVYTDTNGLIETPQGNYTAVGETNYYALASSKANKVYMEILINPGDLPPGFSYRMYGLCTSAVFNEAVIAVGPGKYMPANSVDDYFLDWISTFAPVTNDGPARQVIQIIREF